MILELDLALVTWVLVLNVAVYFIKESKIVSGWLIPLTVIEFVLALVVGVAWGFIVKGFSMASVFGYGLPNGLALGLIACALYDGVHGFTKKKESFLSMLGKVKAFFKKKEKKNED